MIFETNKIDAIRYNRKGEITLYIYDIDCEVDYREHCYYAQKKLENYVNCIINNRIAKRFSIDVNNHNTEIRYNIHFLSVNENYSDKYTSFIELLSNELRYTFKDLISIQRSNFKEISP